MAWMNGCQCGGWKRGSALYCSECNGTNNQRRYSKRVGALASCLTAAALEELRVRAAVSRVNAQATLVSSGASQEVLREVVGGGGGGRDVSWSHAIGIVAFVLNVWGNLALTKQQNRGHAIRLASNACWIAYSPLVGAWALMLNHATFAGINTLGWYRWKRIEEKRDALLRTTTPRPGESG